MTGPRDFSHRGVAVRFTTLTLPTYARGPADPNPPLFEPGTRAIYPYAWKRSFTTKVEQRDYDAVVLATPWLEVTILPDWGMHVYRAVDRLTGRDLFHCPQVMKPAHNARRGEYIGGGVELNAPWGHNVATNDRTALIILPGAEGVSAWFRQYDQQAHTHLTAGVTLTEGFRGLRFDVFLFNGSPLPQPWYFWLNAGIAPHPSLRFLFPTASMLGHFEGPFLETVRPYAYPQHEGVDYSRYAQQPEPLGLFNPGSSTGWFGAWYDDWDFGLARWAAPWRVSGQKFWFWGNSEEGRLWGRIADDRDWSIPEMQSGRPETQMDRGLLPPFSCQSHREWWMPLSELGGVCSASRHGALNLLEQNGKAQLRVVAAEAWPASQLFINGAPIRELGRLNVGQTLTVALPLPLAQLKILSLATPAAGELLGWSAAPTLHASTHMGLVDDLRPLAQASAQRWTQRGARWDRNGRAELARNCYEQALRLDSTCAPALRQLGWQQLISRAPDAARTTLARALQQDRGDELTQYLHALACLQDGDVAQAEADFSALAATGVTYHSAAVVQLILLAWRAGQWDRVDLLLKDGLADAPRQAVLLWLAAIRARVVNNPGEALRQLTALEQTLGASPWREIEMGLLNLPDAAVHLAGEDSAEDARVIDLAGWYAQLQSWDQVPPLLQRTCTSPGRAEALALARYWRIELGKGFSPGLFWAWRSDTQAALTAALSANPQEAHAHFALGCLHAALGVLPTAAEHLRQAHELLPGSLPSVTLGRVLLQMGEPQAARAILEQALTRPPLNPEAWLALDSALMQLRQRDAVWLKRFAAAPAAVLVDERATQCLARLALDLWHLDLAGALLTDRVFHPYELTHDLRKLWARLHRRRALRAAEAGAAAAARAALEQALAYPPNLRLGRPLRTYDAGTRYFAARVCAQLGDAAAARQHQEAAAAEFQPDPTLVKPWSIHALTRLGRQAQAAEQWARFGADATARIACGLHPDQQADLEAALHLADRLQAGWEPSLAELEALLP